MKYQNRDWSSQLAKIACFTIAAVCLFMILFSCTSAPKHLAKAIEKDKPYVAEQTRLLFPCVDIKADTVTVTDSLYEFVECPEQNEYISRVDTVQIEGKTVYVPITKTVKTPVKVARETKYVTVKVEDSAKIYLLSGDLSKKDKTINDLTENVQSKGRWIWRLIGLCILLGIANFIQYKLR